MKIAILSRNRRAYATQRFVETALARGHEYTVVDPLECEIDIGTRPPHIVNAGVSLEGFEAVVPRIGASVTFYGAAVLRQFEVLGAQALNDSAAILRARDRLRYLQTLSAFGVGLPRTAFAHSKTDSATLARAVGGAPLVLKLIDGAGRGSVVLAPTRKAAECLIEAFRQLNAHFVVQEYLKAAAGVSVHCIVVGGRVVTAIRREVLEHDSGLEMGNPIGRIRLGPRQRATAVKAAKTLGLTMAGVNLMDSERGPVVTKINACPGFEEAEGVCHSDVAVAGITYLERRVEAAKGTRRPRP